MSNKELFVSKVTVTLKSAFEANLDSTEYELRSIATSSLKDEIREMNSESFDFDIYRFKDLEDDSYCHIASEEFKDCIISGTNETVKERKNKALEKEELDYEYKIYLSLKKKFEK
jgi:hypothetical protein